MVPKQKKPVDMKRLVEVNSIIAKVPARRRSSIQKLCLQHNTSIEKIPDWLLRKPLRIIKFYLVEGK